MLHSAGLQTALPRHYATLNISIVRTTEFFRNTGLIFYGLPESTGSETFVQTEQLIIKHCHDHLNICIKTKEIERAHRLSHRTGTNRHRPIIVKFTFQQKNWFFQTAASSKKPASVLERISLVPYKMLAAIWLLSLKVNRYLFLCDLKHCIWAIIATSTTRKCSLSKK